MEKQDGLKREEAQQAVADEEKTQDVKGSGREWLSDEEQQSEPEEEQSEQEEEEEEEEEWDDDEEEADVDVDDIVAVDDADEDEEQEEADEDRPNHGGRQLPSTASSTEVLPCKRPAASGSEPRSSHIPSAVVGSIRALSSPLAALREQPIQQSHSNAWDSGQRRENNTGTALAAEPLQCSPIARSTLTTAVDEEEEDDYLADEELRYSVEEPLDDEYGSSSTGSSDVSDDSDSSGDTSHVCIQHDRSASGCGGDGEYPSSCRSGAAALYALSDSVQGLAYHVSTVRPVLSHINTNLELISVQQLHAQVANRRITSTIRCAELGWPAASLSLLAVLVMLLMPLWLPWAWEGEIH